MYIYTISISRKQKGNLLLFYNFLSPGVGMSETFLVAEDRHPRHRIWWTLYVKSETSSSNLIHIFIYLSDIYLYSWAYNLQPTTYNLLNILFIYCL